MHEGFRGKKIAVLGLGIEGESSAIFLKKHGANVTVFDQKEKKDIDPEVSNHLENAGIATVFGDNAFVTLPEYELLVRSPGIRLSDPQLVAAQKKGAAITSQTRLFFDLCPCPIIGVTGTKGKGTTSSLIYEMLKKAGFDAYLGGNIGKPPFSFLDTLNDQSIVVLELSSFQLEDLTKSPHIVVMLMTTREHLAADEWGTKNFHETLEEYINAKRNILRFQTAEDFAVLNKDYPASNESDIHTEATIFKVSREVVVEQGAYVKNGKVWVMIPGLGKPLMDTKDILLPGKHNWENVCAAILAALLAGVKKEAIVHVLKTFKGLEHRLELVGTVRGVRYYDDSFSTTPETAIAAIEAFESPEILVLGGSSKNSDFTELIWKLKTTKNIKAIIGIGKEWKRIKEGIRDNYSSSEHSESRSNSSRQARTIFIEGLKSMEQIIRKASEIAEPGDVVLLSPACASFDMFKNYKDRGEQFKREVFRIKG